MYGHVGEPGDGNEFARAHTEQHMSVAGTVTLGNGAKGRVRGEGTGNVIAAMERAGVQRLICQSTLGAGDSVRQLDWKWWLLFRGPLRWAMAGYSSWIARPAS